MIALARFQLTGYVRSLRVLHPLIAIFLLLMLVLLDQPAQQFARADGYGDTAAMLFPIWAWAARALLDTEPDGQRELSALAIGRRTVLSGLLAAYTLNIGLATVVLTIPLILGTTQGIATSVLLTAIALHLLAAAPATLLGAWTSRAVLPSPGLSVLALLGGFTTLLLLGLGPLKWLTVPIIEWVRAAHDGPTDFVNAFPTLALRLAILSLAAGTAYAYIRRSHP